MLRNCAQVRIGERGKHVGMRARAGGAVVSHLQDPRRAAPPHEIVLKVEPARVGAQARAHGVVAHGHHPRGNSQAMAEVCGDGGQGFARRAPSRTLDMGGEIAVAQRKPSLAAERRERSHERPCLVAPAPAALRVVEAGQRVHDGVEIGRDGEPKMLEIIAGIDDHHEIAAEEAAEPESELGAADPAAQRNDAAFARIAGPAHRNKSSSGGRSSVAAGAGASAHARPRKCTIGLASSA